MEPIYVFGLIILIAIGAKITIFLYRNNQKLKAKEEYRYKIEQQIQAYDKEQQIQQQIQIYPYHAVQILTKNEYYFFMEMKKIIDPIGLQILAKIRLADLIEVDKGLNYADFNRYFAKIKSKHVDFVIVDNMKVVLIVELDDNSHQSQDRQDRDDFVNNALTRSGYIVVRTYGSLSPLIQALADNGYRPNLYTSAK
jgi:hypothetical protein